ncbi:GIY-YIG nuclease family protein, partial [Fulvivirga kasyanovii]
QNLISKKVLTDKDEQKKIRRRIRRIGFHYSDFSSKKGYDVSDLEALLNSGRIKIKDLQEPFLPSISTKKHSPIKATLEDPFTNPDFRGFQQLDNATLDKTGLYCIRVKNTSKLPDRYQKILNKRGNRLIYIGKAQRQTLKKRLKQEVFHTNPGTFFRSIGAVLGYLPIPEYLKGMRNQRNYKFSKTDTQSITNWLIKNTEFSIYPVNLDFTIEVALIKKYCPLLNDKHNPKRLKELQDDREKCRRIAIGK